MLIVLSNLVLFVVEVLNQKVINVVFFHRTKESLTLTASKLINESTATLAALLSALFASRRK
jgi:hypothetical protein